MSADFDRCASVTRCVLPRRTLRMPITISSYAGPSSRVTPGRGSGRNDAMIIGRTCLRGRGATGGAGSRGWRAADCDGGIMTDRTYRVTEIVGTSTEGLEPAIRNALHRAAQTLRHLDWFEVTQIRGQIEDGRVAHFQVGLKLGFRLEDA